MNQVNQTAEKNYIGITIGPIFETIKEAISPASMWFASAFFSEVTRLLCEKVSKGDSKAIISPHSSKLSGLSDGIGKYPDRIFLCSSTIDQNMLDLYIEKVKKELAKDEIDMDDLKEAKDKLQEKAMELATKVYQQAQQQAETEEKDSKDNKKDNADDTEEADYEEK